MLRGIRILILATILGAALRGYALGAKGLWLDEALSWRLSQFPAWELIRRTGEPTTAHPPAYFLLLRWWIQCFGDSEFTMRALSAVAGVLTIPAAWVAVRALQRLATHETDQPKNKATEIPFREKYEPNERGEENRPVSPAAVWARASDLAAILLALSPLHIQLAKQVRGYTFATFLLCAGSFFLVRAVTARDNRSCFILWSMYVLITVTACYTHHLLLLFVAAHTLFLFSYLWLSPRFRRNSAKQPALTVAPSSGRWNAQSPFGSRTGMATRTPVAAVAALLVVGLLYLPWVPHLWGQSENLRSSWSRPLQAQDAARQVYAALLATPVTPGSEPSAVDWCCVALVIAVLLLAPLRQGWPGWFCTVGGMLPVLLLIAYSAHSIRSIFDARYLVFAQIFWLMAAAILVARIYHAAERWLLQIFLIGCSVWGIWDNRHILGSTSRPGIRAAVAHILHSRRGAEPVFVLSPRLLFPAAYYMRHEADRPLYVTDEPARPAQKLFAQLQDEEVITPQQVASRLGPSAWIVTYSPFDLEKNGFLAQPEISVIRRWSFSPELHTRWETPTVVLYYRATAGANDAPKPQPDSRHDSQGLESSPATGVGQMVTQPR
ncbi:MAG: hypothetical protein KatS3mg110_1461 [Pirellulaceae bacterium]|nr:MAG: hypothetical protein KatS3mg110_1461 [Pirellulaceae bacterium]